MGTGGIQPLGHQKIDFDWLMMKNITNQTGPMTVHWKLHSNYKLSKAKRNHNSYYRKSPRPISNARLHMLPYFYLHPINHVICMGTYQITLWENSSFGGLRTYMLSALIRLEHSYRAFTAGAITRTLEVPSSRSSRTKEDSIQISYARTGYGPNCLTTFWTQLACRFNGCQTSPSMWTLGGDKPVIPMVTFIRWAMALPCGTTGSL